VPPVEWAVKASLVQMRQLHETYNNEENKQDTLMIQRASRIALSPSFSLQLMRWVW
jgi:hypothetical protein